MYRTLQWKKCQRKVQTKVFPISDIRALQKKCRIRSFFDTWIWPQSKGRGKWIFLFIFFIFLKPKAELTYNVVSNLCCTAKWLSYTPIYILIFIYILFHVLFHSGLSQDIECISPCSTVRPCCSSIANVIVCIYQPQTPSPALSFPLPHWQPQICASCLWKWICLIASLD